MTAIWDKYQHTSLDDITGLSRQRRWQLRQIHNGKCEKCGRTRGAHGTNTRCAKCVRRAKATTKKVAA